VNWICKIVGHNMSKQKLIATVGPSHCYFPAKCKRCGYTAPYEEKGEQAPDMRRPTLKL
jgi:predicted nucleic-acid-binding Zn-ribbon protein